MASFNSAFAAARKAGKKEFTWNGRKYNTKLKGEDKKSSSSKTAKNVPTPTPRPERTANVPRPTPRPARGTADKPKRKPVVGSSRPVVGGSKPVVGGSSPLVGGRKAKETRVADVPRPTPRPTRKTDSSKPKGTVPRGTLQDSAHRAIKNTAKSAWNTVKNSLSIGARAEAHDKNTKGLTRAKKGDVIIDRNGKKRTVK